MTDVIVEEKIKFLLKGKITIHHNSKEVCSLLYYICMFCRIFYKRNELKLEFENAEVVILKSINISVLCTVFVSGK